MSITIKIIAETATAIIITKSPDSQRSFSISVKIKFQMEKNVLTYYFGSNSLILYNNGVYIRNG
jgi:hypothetical protein